MSYLCQVIEVFRTSIGQVGLLGFFEETFPFPGMQLRDKSGSKWIVRGVGKDLIDSFERKNLLDKHVKSLWDCVLENEDEQHSLNEGTLLYST